MSMENRDLPVIQEYDLEFNGHASVFTSFEEDGLLSSECQRCGALYLMSKTIPLMTRSGLPANACPGEYTKLHYEGAPDCDDLWCALSESVE